MLRDGSLQKKIEKKLKLKIKKRDPFLVKMGTDLFYRFYFLFYFELKTTQCLDINLMLFIVFHNIIVLTHEVDLRIYPPSNRIGVSRP